MRGGIAGGLLARHNGESVAGNEWITGCSPPVTMHFAEALGIVLPCAAVHLAADVLRLALQHNARISVFTPARPVGSAKAAGLDGLLAAIK